MRRILALLFLTALPASAETKWFKGNTHTHTLWSDGNDFAEMVIDWYKQRGYDFLALSDHNILQAKEVWMDVKAVEKRRKALGKTLDGNDPRTVTAIRPSQIEPRRVEFRSPSYDHCEPAH